MAQGWTINATTDVISFYEAPPAGTDNIVVVQKATDGTGGTDVWAIGAWSSDYGYPSEVEFYADRLWFAGTPTDPQTIWASCIGDYANFGRSSPIVDSDAVTFAINARQVNAVKDLVPLDNLLVMTTGGEYKVTGGQDDVVTPSTIGVKNQGNAGSGDIQAKVIGESAIMVQEEGQKIRDLSYKFEKDGFSGNDISVWADHLFAGYSVQWVEYWKAPWQVVWFTRDDGVRVGCTYMPEQEVIGWHWHDTDGRFLDACSLPGKKESECYYLVERVIDGETVQCIEEQASTFAATESDLWFVDCGLQYDGRNVSGTTITLTTAGGWTEDDDLTLTASAALFTGSSDVGDGFSIWHDVTTVDDDGVSTTARKSLRVVIDAYTSGTVVTVRSIGEVPADLRDVALTTWTLQRDTIGGLWHLEGKRVAVLQDAAVVGPLLVTNGQITLATGSVVTVGLPYTAEVETLELNAPGGESMRDQNKLAYAVSILLLASRGVKFGNVADGKLYPAKERRFEPYGQPTFLRTGIADCNIPAGWGVDAGRVRIVSDDPLPLEILSITTRAVASNGQAAGGRG